MQALTHLTFWIEALGPALLFVPFFRWQVRVANWPTGGQGPKLYVQVRPKRPPPTTTTTTTTTPATTTTTP